MRTLKPIDRSSKVIVSDAGPVYVPPHPGPFAEEMTSSLFSQVLELASEAERQANASTREDLIAEALVCWGLSRLRRR
jgi:hypothetical protein